MLSVHNKIVYLRINTTHTHTHTCVCVCVRACVRAWVRAWVHVRIYTDLVFIRSLSSTGNVQML